jgi:4-amino-4-deoxychorismate lyase
MPAQGALRDRDGGLALIETLRREADGTFVRRDRHLARLRASAAALDFVHDDGAVEKALDSLSGRDGPLRVRLELARDGTATVTAAPFAAMPEGTVWRLRLATVHLDPADPLLRHKTTRRAAYDAARAEFTLDLADEVLLLNTRGEVCEGTFTNIFASMDDGGPLLTPPLACGLLAGVLRQELLESGKAREAVLTPADLRAAKALFVGNSLRGLIAARLAERTAAT